MFTFISEKNLQVSEFQKLLEKNFEINLKFKKGKLEI